MNRRELLKNIGLSSGALAIGGNVIAESSGRLKSKRILRIAHITDVHIRPEQNAPETFFSMVVIPFMPQIMKTSRESV